MSSETSDCDDDSSGAPIRSTTLLAPAKINLYLHITGRRDDGYHLLDSLVAFADIGDGIRIDPAAEMSFSTHGLFANIFHAAQRAAGPESENLAVRAVHALASAAGRDPLLHLSLTKNLPAGAGLGGGSSDAATVLWALIHAWKISAQAPFLNDLARTLGADVPVCLAARASVMRGAGECLSPAPALPEMPVVLAWPGKTCATPAVYKAYAESAPIFRAQETLPESFDSPADLIAFLKTCANDLAASAIRIVPETEVALAALRASPGCALAQVCGSGSASFGLFEDEASAFAAAEEITRAQPSWWVRAGWIGRVDRY